MISKPSTIERGVGAEFVLDKLALSLHTSVALNTYFRDTNVWHAVQINYESDVRNQRETVVFEAKKENPTAIFRVSPRSVGNFRVFSLTIIDSDGGTLTIPRSELITANLDVLFP